MAPCGIRLRMAVGLQYGIDTVTLMLGYHIFMIL